MPKIIENIENVILTEAKRQVMTYGYSKMTIRSVASACGIAAGTIYNYYPSKDILIASFMLSDWLSVLDRMKEVCNKAKEPSEAFLGIHTLLEEYRSRYSSVFCDGEAEKSTKGIYASRHVQLRSQIASLLMPICAKHGDSSPFTADFIAEALLSWTDSECEYSRLENLLCKILK